MMVRVAFAAALLCCANSAKAESFEERREHLRECLRQKSAFQCLGQCDAECQRIRSQSRLPETIEERLDNLERKQRALEWELRR